MSQLHMDPEQHHHHHQEQTFDDGTTNWHDNGAYSHPQHQSPVQDYNGFANYAPLPMEPLYTTGMHPPRTTHPQLQPLIMPTQWPSMLTSQSSYVPPIFPSAPVPITPASATPVSAVSATSTHSRTSSTPRKTLTDADRRRMCQYHEDHPTVKQTEIGAMFGVERSTVSKVLRQKEKYLYQDDGSRSPIKRSKGKFPDIERALSNWARNHQRQGLPLTDAIIREKARFFATTVGNSDSHLKANSSSWLEKFKQKNNLMGAKSRKGSIAEESEGTSNPPSNVHTPGGISPASPSGVSPSPITIAAKKSEENLNLKTESPDSYDFSSHHRPFHSQSNTSLSSVFTDTAPSSFSAGPTSPTSPFFTPDSACGPSPFIGSQQGRGPPGSSNFQRPRSQTFPMLIGVEQYMSPPPSSEALTPKYISSTVLESPMEVRSSSTAIDDAMQASPTTVTNTMQPPPIPTAQSGSLSSPAHMGMEGAFTPSQEEAARALELVMSFFQQQPTGFVEPQEYVMIGKLMEKLKIKRNSESLGSGMRRVSEPDFGTIHKVEI